MFVIHHYYIFVYYKVDKRNFNTRYLISLEYMQTKNLPWLKSKNDSVNFFMYRMQI